MYPRYHLGQYISTCHGNQFPFKLCTPQIRKPVQVFRKQRIPLPRGPYFAPVSNCPMGFCNQLLSKPNDLSNVFMSPLIKFNKFDNILFRIIFTINSNTFAMIIPNNHVQKILDLFFENKMNFTSGSKNFKAYIRSKFIKPPRFSNNQLMLNIDTDINDSALHNFLDDVKSIQNSVIFIDNDHSQVDIDYIISKYL